MFTSFASNIADMVVDHAQDAFDRLKRNQELLIRAGQSPASLTAGSASLTAGSALAMLANYRSSLLGPEPLPEVGFTATFPVPAQDFDFGPAKENTLVEIEITFTLRKKG